MIKKKFLISLFLFVSFFYSSLALSQVNEALNQQALKVRKIQYRLLLSLFLQKLNKDKTIKSKETHALYFRIYRTLLKQLYIDMKYSFLMGELKITKKAFLKIQIKPDPKKILKLLFSIRTNLTIIQKKSEVLVKKSNEQLLKYASLLELEPTDLKLIIRTKLK